MHSISYGVTDVECKMSRSKSSKKGLISFLAHLSICSGWAFVIALRPSSIVRPASVWCPSGLRPASVHIFKQHLLCNHWPVSIQTLSEASVRRGNEKLLNFLARVIPLVAMATRYQILKNLLLRDRLLDSIFFYRNVCQWTVFQIPSKNSISLKNMAARGRGHFSIYGFFVNFAYFQHISVITFTKCKIFSSNLFTITRATFWPKDTILYCTLNKLPPFKDF